LKYFIVIGGGDVRLFVLHCWLIWQFGHLWEYKFQDESNELSNCLSSSPAVQSKGMKEEQRPLPYVVFKQMH
ncbi:hypothetical protein T11_2382, partial [Trichinella zimbabwensis]